MNNGCQFIGHQDFKPTSVCILKECNYQTRLCCTECIVNGIHRHGQQYEIHIKKQQDFIEYIQQKQIEFSNITQQLKQIRAEKLNNLTLLVEMFISQIEKLKSVIEQKNKINFDSFISQAINGFPSLKKKQIDELIDHNPYGIKLQDLQDSIQNITIQYQDLQFQQIKAKEIEELQLAKFNYFDYFEQTDKAIIVTFQISQNEQFIAYGGNNKLLTIIDLPTKQILKQIKYDNNVRRCKFTNDSSIIYCGDYEGFIYGYDVYDNFKEIYKKRIHDNRISDIICISNDIVASCSDSQIIISDLKRRNQLLQINQDSKSYIFCMEYNPINSQIVSCSCYKSIRFFSSINGDLIIDQQNAHDEEVYQIKFINNYINLISRSLKEIRKWLIDYEQNKLILIGKFLDNQFIYSFASILNDSFIIKIYSNDLLIMDNTMKPISSHAHKIDNLWLDVTSNQSETMNYILLLGNNKVKVLKRTN